MHSRVLKTHAPCKVSFFCSLQILIVPITLAQSGHSSRCLPWTSCQLSIQGYHLADCGTQTGKLVDILQVMLPIKIVLSFCYALSHHFCLWKGDREFKLWAWVRKRFHHFREAGFQMCDRRSTVRNQHLPHLCFTTYRLCFESGKIEEILIRPSVQLKALLALLERIPKDCRGKNKKNGTYTPAPTRKGIERFPSNCTTRRSPSWNFLMMWIILELQPTFRTTP